jgi:adenylate cyclase
MMGDTVNLAARLESGAKQYGVFSMASEETINATNSQILSRELDLIRVVGKSEPVRIFELLCKKENTTPELKKCVKLFSEGLGLYRLQKWDKAMEAFTECLKYEPHHPDTSPGCKTTPSHVFLKRCAQYKTGRDLRLPGDWDGVYTATEK